MSETPMQSRTSTSECPKCGARTRLYRTPRGLRCAECVKLMDSAGLGFR
jgi:tRNA(Ile2) C34 agmatinyltransferase TiaS